MPDEHPIRIRIDGEQPPITVGAMVNLSGPNDHAKFEPSGAGEQLERPTEGEIATGQSIPLLHDQPRALFLADVELLRGSGFGCLAIRRLDEPEKLDTVP